MSAPVKSNVRARALWLDNFVDRHGGRGPRVTAHREHPEYPGLVAGCPECIAEAREAAWVSAPKRMTTWTFRYQYGGPKRLTVRIVLPIPDGDWRADEIDARYASESAYPFVEAFEKAHPAASTDRVVDACMTVRVEQIVIGEIVRDEPEQTVEALSLFGGEE